MTKSHMNFIKWLNGIRKIPNTINKSADGATKPF
jgi:hypothetical protein